MKRFIVLGALALCLLSGTAMADKAKTGCKYAGRGQII